MNLTKENLKRPVNGNFIMILSLVFILVGIALVTFAATNSVDKELAGVESGMEEIRGQGEREDVAGHALLAYGLVYVIGSLATGVVKIFFGIIPLILAGGLLLLTFVARLLYTDSDGRLLAYRAIMTFVYIIVGILELLSVGTFFWSISLEGERLAVVLVILAVVVYLAAILFFGIRNTYSDRIKY